MLTRSLRALALVLPVVCALSLPQRAQAGGFYLLPRGARGISQGGAVVASSDDPGALWYNPAGLAYSGNQALADFVLPIQTVELTRIDGGGNRLDTVKSTSTPLPIPGFGASHNFGLKTLTFGIGVMAPTAALNNWEACLEYDANNRCIKGAPQRYSLVSMSGSGFGNLSLGVAWRPIKQLSLGGAFNAVIGRFAVDVVMSLCDNGPLCSTPESPRYDGRAKITVPSGGMPFIVRPAGSLGAVIDLTDIAPVPVRIGASWTSRFVLKGEAKLDVDIPDEGLYKGATLTNNTADFAVKFPDIFRFGLEVRPVQPLRLEAQLTYEAWSIQEKMEVRPKNIAIKAPAVGNDSFFELGSLDMKRGMNDVIAVGVGSEYTLNDDWLLRAGAMYEKGSLPDAYMNVVTPDSDKLLIGLGGAWKFNEQISVDFTAGHVFVRNRNVTCTKVFQPYPLRPPVREPDCAEQRAINAGLQDRDPASAEPIGNGKYVMDIWFVGTGVRYRFGDGGKDASASVSSEEITASAAPSEPENDQSGAAAEWESVPAAEEPPPAPADETPDWER